MVTGFGNILAADTVAAQVPAMFVPTLDGGGKGPFTVKNSAMVDVAIIDPTPRQVLYEVLTVLPTVVMIAVLLVALTALAHRTRHATPRSPAVLGRLRALAVLALVGGCLAEGVQIGAQYALTRSVVGELAFFRIGLEQFGWWLLVAFGLAACAEIAHRAARTQPAAI
ncbi:hypothetical protein AB0M43_36090 [Longispora sp. NPDC051575]|uniref:hypothetical protein n=1 Tax=Longispora sp. NPDC051575 TaxID=3154943 RepID=UPI00342708AA